MRDERGRYHNLKEIADNGPEWATGCPDCEYGVKYAPPLTGAVALIIERVVQAADGAIQFCPCRAGQAYRIALGAQWKRIQAQTRSDKAIRTHKVAGSEEPLTPLNMLRIDDEIEIARSTIYAALEKNRPTIHA